jgi:hypothetical protein
MRALYLGGTIEESGVTDQEAAQEKAVSAGPDGS